MKKPRQTIARMIVARELARRYVKFHDGKDWRSIKLWGVALWGSVSKLIESGEILTDGYTKENKTIWYRPSEDFYHWLVVPAIAFFPIGDRLLGNAPNPF